MLSIVIPTLNEENYLPRLLNCIKKQNFKDYEIIVADANSKDKTREVAKAFGCKIVKGGLPAIGKNVGAKASKGDLILFLDADLLLPDNFLKDALKEFQDRNLDIASFFLSMTSEKILPTIFFNLFYNYPLRLFGKRWPRGAMGILVRKNIHKSLKGFNEEIKLAEDSYYFRKASKIGKFGAINSTKLFPSLRRFQYEGWLKPGIKYIFMEIYMDIFGCPKKEIFKYEFNYPKNKIL